MEMFFATSNTNKFREAKKILGPGIELKQARLDIAEIQSLDVKAIAEDKARKAYGRVGKPVIVEDTALCMKAWKGFPGPLITWVIKTIGIEGMCRLLGKERSAEAEACVAYCDGKTLKVFSGIVKGRIARKPRGRKRFDWDRIFIPDGFGETFAEMKLSEKNRISHRMKAFARLRKCLEKTAQRTA